jgi:hypothetical protein
MNPNPQFFKPQPSHLIDWAQVYTAENGQYGVHACVHMYSYCYMRVRTRHAWMSSIMK